MLTDFQCKMISSIKLNSDTSDLERLRTIIAEYCGCEEKYVKTPDIADHLMVIVETCHLEPLSRTIKRAAPVTFPFAKAGEYNYWESMVMSLSVAIYLAPVSKLPGLREYTNRVEPKIVSDVCQTVGLT